MAIYQRPSIRIVGDRGILIEYGDSIDPEVNRKVRAVARAIQEARTRGLVEVVPTYRSILVVYDPMITDPSVLEKEIMQLQDIAKEIQLSPPRLVEIPVCYGGEFGPDIEFVASHARLSVEEVIRIHSSPTYQIYMMGFTPGFPFLGGLPGILATPRLETPRLSVPAGSVAVAENQTGIYPITSPGGWRLIGRTPLRLFFPEREEPFLYRPGDLIKFRPISRDEYQELKERGT